MLPLDRIIRIPAGGAIDVKGTVVTCYTSVGPREGDRFGIGQTP
jgi:hypothetical protein